MTTCNRPQATTEAATLSEADRLRAKRLVEEIGLPRAAQVLGIGREPLARFIGGLALRAGTEMLIAIGLAALVGGARGSPPAESSTSSAAAVMPGPTETR